eukprot:TRINITY_DN41496_c0_g1_i1.p1 TRINITY_DN41496_c0_g1~~TRINITY_DN41496_c0_g1_i1.p1  ORF type:complete len:499 (+),score=106.08 TRINITY_DN41496_c0_g1_i1:130-1497(+)
MAKRQHALLAGNVSNFQLQVPSGDDDLFDGASNSVSHDDDDWHTGDMHVSSERASMVAIKRCQEPDLTEDSEPSSLPSAEDSGSWETEDLVTLSEKTAAFGQNRTVQAGDISNIQLEFSFNDDEPPGITPTGERNWEIEMSTPVAFRKQSVRTGQISNAQIQFPPETDAIIPDGSMASDMAQVLEDAALSWETSTLQVCSERERNLQSGSMSNVRIKLPAEEDGLPLELSPSNFGHAKTIVVAISEDEDLPNAFDLADASEEADSAKIGGSSGGNPDGAEAGDTSNEHSASISEEAETCDNSNLDTSGIKGRAYAVAVNNGRRLLARRMVKYDSSTPFSSLLAGIFADALGHESSNSIEALLLEGGEGISALRRELSEMDMLEFPYWVCAFSTNHHSSICNKPDVSDLNGSEYYVCTCTTAKHLQGAESEINKTDDVECLLKECLDLKLRSCEDT